MANENKKKLPEGTKIEDYYTVKQLCERLGVKYSTVATALTKGFKASKQAGVIQNIAYHNGRYPAFLIKDVEDAIVRNQLTIKPVKPVTIEHAAA